MQKTGGGGGGSGEGDRPCKSLRRGRVRCEALRKTGASPSEGPILVTTGRHGGGQSSFMERLRKANGRNSVVTSTQQETSSVRV